MPFLRKVLADYADILTAYEKERETPKAVRVIITGNTPRKQILADSPRYASIDGRPSDLSSDISAAYIPMISDVWNKHFTWRGKGPMPEPEKAHLLDMVKQASERHRRLRFWGEPQNAGVWKQLLASGVDLLNVDDLDALRRFHDEK